jgi:hypothetical protein
MKATIEDLKDTFKIGYEIYEDSRKEAMEVWDLFHNRHYTQEQLSVLANRGQPKETFNVFKMFGRMLIGYYSTVINTIKFIPIQQQDVAITEILNNLVNYVLRKNNMGSVGDDIKLGGLLSGLFSAYIDVVDSGRRDEFGRPIYDIELEYVPDYELVLDPMSRKEDYSDARFIHRFRWLNKEQVIKLFGKRKVDELEANYNFLNVEEAELSYKYDNAFAGYYKLHDNYLIVHSIIVDDKDEVWSIYWSGDTILEKKKVTFKKVRFPYRILKLHKSDKEEYYGIMREVIEPQKAINQALLKIQLLVNTQKALVQHGAVDNLAEFTAAFNRVSGVIPVNDLNGIKIENISPDIQQQYLIINNALDRIQKILGINDSFLGMAYASDSGKKVQLQQNATILALRFASVKIEKFYKLLGMDIANLIQQYFTAHQIINLNDDDIVSRWLEINKPLMKYTGRILPDGTPEQIPVFVEALNPDTGEPLIDEEGNYIMVPVTEKGSDIYFTDFDVEVQSVAYNDTNEQNRQMLETLLGGPVGQLLMQIAPAQYFKIASLTVKNIKLKNSSEVAEILSQVSAALGGSPQLEQQAQMMAQDVSQLASQPNREG